VRYFRDKPTLYAALLDDLFGDLLGRYEAALAGPGTFVDRYLRTVEVWANHVEARPALLRIVLWEMARANEGDVPLAARVRPLVEFLCEAVRTGQRAGVFRDVDPVAFVMSVAGTTAFLGLRTPLLGSSVAPPLRPGTLAAELRSWVERIIVVP
jgi:AcrR family transcriptional regulator